MSGITCTLFSDRMIRFSTLKQFWKHFTHGQVKKPFQWHVMTKIKIMKPYLTSTTFAHEVLCNITLSLTDTYLPYSIFLAQPLFMQAPGRELLILFYTFGMVRQCYSNPRPPALKVDALPTELSRRLITIKFEINQSGESHYLVTHSVKKYAACTNNPQIR